MNKVLPVKPVYKPPRKCRQYPQTFIIKGKKKFNTILLSAYIKQARGDNQGGKVICLKHWH